VLLYPVYPEPGTRLCQEIFFHFFFFTGKICSFSSLPAKSIIMFSHFRNIFGNATPPPAIPPAAPAATATMRATSSTMFASPGAAPRGAGACPTRQSVDGQCFL
jgi:hypothetical protein